MGYIGKWKFHSIGTVDDETCERVWLNAEEYMNSPMPYVDESDEELVADEIKERKRTIGTLLEVCEDGKLYVLMPLPECVSKEEVDAAVKAGVIKIRDGMMADEPYEWEERNGEIWVNMGMSNEYMQFSGDGEFLTMITTRYERV